MPARGIIWEHNDGCFCIRRASSSIQILNRTALDGWIRRTRTYRYSAVISSRLLTPSHRNYTTQHHDSSFVASTMADNLRSKAKMLEIDTDSPSGVPDESKSVSISSILAQKLEIDESSEVGHIFVSPTFSITLFQLLCSLKRDIFYAIGRDDLHSQGGPSLTLSVKQKYPFVDCKDFLEKYKKCSATKQLGKNLLFWKPDTKHKNCRWLLIKSVSDQKDKN
jgi:hypothetical protein